MKIPLFSLTLNIKNFEENKLEKILKKFNNEIGIDNFIVELEFHEKYYKYPNEERCIINIFSKKYVFLKEVLRKYKDILWKYRFSGDGFFENDGILYHFRDEDAYWNSEFQKASFLHSDVTWVNFIVFPIAAAVCEEKELD